MGTPGFDLGLQAAQQRTLERQRIAEQQRVEQQNTVGAQLLDAINNASNVKDTRKNPDTGALEHNPEYDTAQQAKQQLLTQYVGLNSPAQHASFGQRLHGLIFGHPTDQQREPALNSAAAADQSNVAPPSPVQAAGEAVGDVGDTTPHPMATSHPVLDKMHAGVEALKNHLSAFAHPLPPQPQPDANLIAQYYRDPGEVAF